MNLHLQFDFVATLGSYNLQEKDNPFKKVFFLGSQTHLTIDISPSCKSYSDIYIYISLNPS